MDELLSKLVSGTAAEWANFIAEVGVAVVIYLELRNNRAVRLLDEVVAWKQREERGGLYKSFWSIQTGLIDESKQWKDRRRRFCDQIMVTPELRSICDAQIVYFSNLFYTIQKIRGWFFGRYTDKWFPHVVVRFWIVAGRYVIERQSEQGAWTGHAIMDFTLRSISFLKKQKAITVFRDYTCEDQKVAKYHEISRSMLDDLELEIKSHRALRPSERLALFLLTR